MDFNISDGVGLVRSLTEKVMSVMSKVVIEPPDIDSGGEDVRNLPRRSFKQPEFNQNIRDITENVNELVKHKKKLSAVNLLPVNKVSHVYVDAKTGNDGFTSGGKFGLQSTQKDYPDGKKIGLVNPNNVINALKTSADVPAKFGERIPLFTRTVRYHEPVNNMSDGTSCKFRSTWQPQEEHVAHKYNCNNNTKANNHILVSDNNSDSYTSLSTNSQYKTNDLFKKEFENDMQFLTGCNNRMSTPEKDRYTPPPTQSKTDATHTAETRTKYCLKPVETKISDTTDFTVSNDVQGCIVRTRAISPHKRVLSTSPYRRQILPISPLARPSVNSKPPHVPCTNTAISTTNSSSEIGKDKTAWESKDINKQRPVLESTSEKRPSVRRIHPKASLISRSLSGARRSLFSEPSILNRLLPFDSRQSDKPLGYDAYQQFQSMSKTDVLPKYFFENEDEEAVYYLKVKYLDDGDSKS